MMIDDWTEFDILWENEELRKERKKKLFEEEQEEVTPAADLGIDRERLISMTKKAIKEETERREYVSPEMIAEVQAQARELAANIIEWVYLSAEAGEWSYTHDMSKFPASYLRATVRETKRLLPDVMVRYCEGKTERWIEVKWTTSYEV
jgi:hypothetical protein